jgi:hypothetical protein
VEKSVGAFILQFGKVEYALMVTIIEVNRIIDGTTIQAKFPYGFDEMCKFLRTSEREFLDDVELPPFDKIVDELEDLNKIRTVLVHSYLSGKITKPEGTWFRFERFAAVVGAKNRRKIESYRVKKEFIDDSLSDLMRARSWLIQLSERLRKKSARNPGSDAAPSTEDQSG